LRPAGKGLAAAFLIASFVGFSDATYLAAAHYLGRPVECSVFTDCEKVTKSPYAVFAGLPLGVWGAAYYLSIFLLMVGYLDTRDPRPARIAAGLTPFGFLASVWFVYLQLFVIEAVCPYCMLSAALSGLLFVLGLIVWFRRPSAGFLG
jgi:uncharacterized membrane protein